MFHSILLEQKDGAEQASSISAVKFDFSQQEFKPEIFKQYTQQIIPKLLETLKETKDKGIKKSVIKALGNFISFESANKDIISGLLDVLDSENEEEIKINAIFSLTKFERCDLKVSKKFLDVLRKKDCGEKVKKSIVFCLGFFESNLNEIIAELLKIVKSINKKDVKILAIEALGNFVDSETITKDIVSELLDILDDTKNEEENRVIAVFGLTKFEKRDPRVLERFLNILDQKDYNKEIREAVVFSLGSFESDIDKIISELLKIIESSISRSEISAFSFAGLNSFFLLSIKNPSEKTISVALNILLETKNELIKLMSINLLGILPISRMLKDKISLEKPVTSETSASMGDKVKLISQGFVSPPTLMFSTPVPKPLQTQKDTIKPKSDPNKKIWLTERWDNEVDSLPKRLIFPIITRKTSPINYSIISDDLQYFKENYKKDEYLITHLERACICGSEKIAKFLLHNLLGETFVDEKYSYLLGYVSASKNKIFAIEIAQEMSKRNISMPDSVFDFASDYQMIDAIKEVFDKNKTTSFHVG